jgi:hypothetical protein
MVTLKRSRRSASFEQSLESQCAEVERIEAAAAPELWKSWLELFAAPAKRATGEWTPGGYHWHTFSYGYTYALSGTNALAAYAGAWRELDPRKRGLRLLLLPSQDHSLAYRCVAPQPLVLDGSERIICPLDFSWTMAFTHEDGWLGPYFTRQEWVLHPPPPAPTQPPGRSGSPRKKRRR